MVVLLLLLLLWAIIKVSQKGFAYDVVAELAVKASEEGNLIEAVSLARLWEEEGLDVADDVVEFKDDLHNSGQVSMSRQLQLAVDYFISKDDAAVEDDFTNEESGEGLLVSEICDLYFGCRTVVSLVGMAALQPDQHHHDGG